jgi:hypothetical protein
MLAPGFAGAEVTSKYPQEGASQGSRTAWRKFVEEFSSDTQLPNSKGLWNYL